MINATEYLLGTFIGNWRVYFWISCKIFYFRIVSIIIENEFNSNFMIDFFWKFNILFKNVYKKNPTNNVFLFRFLKKSWCFYFSLRHLGFTRCPLSRFSNPMYLLTQNSSVFENRWRLDWDRVQSVKR
jgi:hypothetical protein